MEKVKVSYPIAPNSEPDGTSQFIMKTIAASLCGASIPAVIFYFLM